MIIKILQTALFTSLIFMNVFFVYSQQPTWKILPGSPSVGMSDVYFINPNTGWIAGQKIYRTNNGGLNWTYLNSIPEYARSIGFLDSLNGFIGTLTAARPLYRTTDGGDNWTLVTGLSVTGICGISVVNSNTIYGCGRFDQPAKVIKSTKGVIHGKQ